ncbi:MAG: UDP-3-O-(3-hydroxymyristoyl)glucosamine N-acyltransferase [Phycisphaerales bacterium]|nr:UDP-3-O-(3-hydroxymyristoyl)glucosamine N-acyltransferase [Phycisphaerales bacterium]
MTSPSQNLSDDKQAQVSIRAQELAHMVEGELFGNPDIVLTHLAPIEEGSSGSLTFIRAQSFAKHWENSGCQAALVTKGVDVPNHNPDQRALIFVPDADLAIVQILRVLDPGIESPPIGVHPSAQIDPGARVDPTASVGPGCVICKDATVGPSVVLIANVYIGKNSSVGSDTFIHPGVVIGDRCTIGQRGLIFANSVIGSDGFGFLTPTDTRPVTKVPQIGSVEIGDDVEIGACSTIDRAKFGATKIGNRTKLDNQVHIAHNCIVGDDVLLCGRTTLGGSATIGDRSLIGGAVVLNDQARVGKDVKIAGGAMVLDEIQDGETVLGVPAMPSRTALANVAAQRNLAKFCRRVDKTLKKLDDTYTTS